MNNNQRDLVGEYLDNQFYSGDGEFSPIISKHGNVDADLADLRNTYMKAEREYFITLLKKKEIRDQFAMWAYSGNYTADEIFEKAMLLQDDLENGKLYTPEEEERMKQMSPEERDKFHMSRLENVEGLIALLYAAAKDKGLVLEYLIPYRTDIPFDIEETSRRMGL